MMFFEGFLKRLENQHFPGQAWCIAALHLAGRRALSQAPQRREVDAAPGTRRKRAWQKVDGKMIIFCWIFLGVGRDWAECLKMSLKSCSCQRCEGEHCETSQPSSMHTPNTVSKTPSKGMNIRTSMSLLSACQATSVGFWSAPRSGSNALRAGYLCGAIALPTLHLSLRRGEVSGRFSLELLGVRKGSLGCFESNVVGDFTTGACCCCSENHLELKANTKKHISAGNIPEKRRFLYLWVGFCGGGDTETMKLNELKLFSFIYGQINALHQNINTRMTCGWEFSWMV